MKEFIVISLTECEPYEYDIKEILFVTRNFKQAQYLESLFLDIERFLSGDHNRSFLSDLNFQSVILNSDTGKVDLLVRHNANWNYSYRSEDIILDIPESRKDAEKEMEDFNRFNRDDGSAYIKEFPIVNSLTKSDIKDIVCKAFRFNQNDLDLIKKAIKDFKSGEYFSPENTHKYGRFANYHK